MTSSGQGDIEDEEAEVERAANLEIEAIDALSALKDECGYSEQDIERMLKGTGVLSR
jgi:hypothetical protein